jgi:hypothetical protein
VGTAISDEGYQHPPGSAQAVNDGCKCPILDNRRGKGCGYDEAGNPVYWFNKDCPLHGRLEDIDKETIIYPER